MTDGLQKIQTRSKDFFLQHVVHTFTFQQDDEQKTHTE